MTSNARYALGDGDGSKGGAILKSITSNARYAVGDGNGIEGGAKRESTTTNPFSSFLNGISR